MYISGKCILGSQILFLGYFDKLEEKNRSIQGAIFIFFWRYHIRPNKNKKNFCGDLGWDTVKEFVSVTKKNFGQKI